MAQIGDDTQTDFSFTLLGTTTKVDPPDVSVIVRAPDLTEEVFVYGVDPEITNLGVGDYRFKYRVISARTYVVRPIGEGATLNDAQEVLISVDESYFSDPLP